MISKKIWIPVLCAAALALGATMVQPEHGASAQPAQSLDPKALETLKLMSYKLSQAKSLRFETRSMVPIKSPNGMWISLYGTSRVVKEGPKKLFVETRGDFFPYDFYFDGKAVTAFSPTKNFYAVKEAPGSVDDVIEAAYREEGKSFPYSDILVSEPYKILSEGLFRAVYVGQSVLRPLSGAEGVTTDHLLFANNGVEWQIWIDTVDHLPRMVCATYFENDGEPSYTVEFGDWKLDEAVSPETFTYKNTTKASKVEFRNPMQPGRGVPTGAADQQ